MSRSSIRFKKGDNLWKVAEAAYGKGKGPKYTVIFEANKPMLSDPDKIYPGQVLRIPDHRNRLRPPRLTKKAGNARSAQRGPPHSRPSRPRRAAGLSGRRHPGGGAAGSALPPGNAAHRQAVERADDQLRRRWAGWPTRPVTAIRTTIRSPERHGRLSPAAAEACGTDLTGYPRPPQACLVNFYDTVRPHGPAPGPRRERFLRSGAVGLARRRLSVPHRWHRATAADPIVPA
jgi:hypothetical protein